MPNYTAFGTDPPVAAPAADLIKTAAGTTMKRENAVARIKQRLLVLFRSGPGMRLLLVLFGMMVVTVVFIGLDDIPGYVLAYLATSILFVMLVHGWRSIKNYVILLLATLCGIIFLSFFYVEVISRFVRWLWGVGALESTPMRIIEWVISNVMLFVGPVGVVFGFFGALILGIRRLVKPRKRADLAGHT